MTKEAREINWIKIKIQMFDDEKIKLLQSYPEGDSLIVIWIRLLCIAGKTNENGLIQLNQNIGFTDEMLGTIFNKDVKIIRLALVTLRNFGMIEIFENNKISIINWEKHQNIEGMDKVRELNKERQKKHREHIKSLEHNNLQCLQSNNLLLESNVTLRDDNVTVTPQKRRKNKEEDIIKNNKKELNLLIFSEIELPIIQKWINYRKEIKKPITQSSIETIKKDIQKKGLDYIDKQIENSIRNGWQGLFEIKKDEKNEKPAFDKNCYF